MTIINHYDIYYKLIALIEIFTNHIITCDNNTLYLLSITLRSIFQPAHKLFHPSFPPNCDVNRVTKTIE